MFFLSLYEALLSLFSRGPWGPLHRVWIFLFRKFFGIPDSAKNYRTLSDFFLRDREFELSSANLVSPAESHWLEGPSFREGRNPILVKGIDYAWQDFSEFDGFKDWGNFTFWNFYLSPSCYHWVHAPASGKNLKSILVKGAIFPVNAFGRWYEPKLYARNGRVSFAFESEIFGRVAVICVGALGVSRFREPLGVSEPQWKDRLGAVEKGQRLLGFEFGSSVLLVVERNPSPDSFLKCQLKLVNVGEGLSQAF